jgi:hypothetical protein
LHKGKEEGEEHMTKDDICRWIHMAWDFTNQSEDNLKQKFQYLEAHYLPYEKFAKLVANHEREACAKLVEPLDESLADEIRARNA